MLNSLFSVIYSCGHMVTHLSIAQQMLTIITIGEI